MGIMKTTRTCTECGRVVRLLLDSISYARWQRGALVQIAFPHLSDDDREILVSGICGKCFDKIGEQEEREEEEEPKADEEDAHIPY